MRIVFFGSGAFGLPTLQMLATEHEVVGVITQPDKPAGRGGSMTPTPIGQWATPHAHTRGLPRLSFEDVNAPDATKTIRALPCDLFVVIAFGQKLSPALLEDRFAINLHASLLPRWRGAAPIHAAILAGDKETGNSIITLAQTMDAGLILDQSRRPILPNETTGELHDQLSFDGPGLVRHVFQRFATGDRSGRPQDPALITRAKKLHKSDGWVDFSRPADECRCRINGLSPWPGVTALFRGHPLKLLKADFHESLVHSASHGSLVEPEHGTVACGGGSSLRLLEVQPPGKKAMSWESFAAGHRPTRDDLLSRAPEPDTKANANPNTNPAAGRVGGTIEDPA
jgi:methionyl-tRNA formyltransferase